MKDIELTSHLTLYHVFADTEEEWGEERDGRPRYGLRPAGLSQTLHEVGDVHVGNRTQVDLPTPRGTVGGMVHSCSKDLLHCYM